MRERDQESQRKGDSRRKRESRKQHEEKDEGKEAEVSNGRERAGRGGREESNGNLQWASALKVHGENRVGRKVDKR